MPDLTKVTNTVIEANTITFAQIESLSLINRNYAAESVSQDKLSSNANTQFYDTQYRANDFITFTQLNANINVVNSNVGSPGDADANDFNTFTSLTANVNQVQGNVTSITDGTTAFTGALITFNNDVTISGDFIVEGDSFTANVGTLIVEDANIILNSGGSNATAQGAGLEVLGTGTPNVVIGLLEFKTASTSGWRVGTGNSHPTLGTPDDVARTQDYQANDEITFTQLTSDFQANDFITYTQLNANINVVSGNVEAGGNLVSFINTNSSVNVANVFFIGSPTTASTANNITVTIDGLTQSQDQWVLNGGNNTVQFTDSALQSGLEIHIVAWHAQ